MKRREMLFGLVALAAARVAVAEARVERDVVYSEGDGEKLLMDVYHGDGPGPHPAVLLVHGGGWLGGTKEGYNAMGPRLAAHGFTACSINYRLAPKYPYPAAMDDCHHAIRWLRANAKRFDIDPEHVGALGDSAGGHLVALIGVRDARPGTDRELSKYRSRPDAVVSNYGAHELVRMWQIEQAHKPLTEWLGGPPEQFAKVYREASPVAMADRKAPPFLIIHGDQDKVNPPEQSDLLQAALVKQKVDSTRLVIPGAGHGWALDSEQGRMAEAATLEFLDKHLKRRP